MLHAGLDLSRKRLDVCVLDVVGERVITTTCPPDADGLRHLVEEVRALGSPVTAAIESMNGARYVHDTLELHGWEVEIADAQKVKGVAPWRARPTRSTPGCWPSSPAVTWSRLSGCPRPGCGPSVSGRAFACTWCATA